MHQELLKELSVITDEERRILDGHTDIEHDRYTEKKELIVDCEKLIQKGKLIQVRPHTRFVRFPKHRHNYVEVIYMCQGTTTHIVDGNRVVLEQGDLLFLNQHAVQEIEPAKEEDIAINFIIVPEFFNMAFSMMGDENNALKDFLIGTLCSKDGMTSYLYFHVADILPIQNLVENMVWTIFYDMGNKRSSNQITMGLLLLQLLNHMDKMETGNSRRESHPRKLSCRCRLQWQSWRYGIQRGLYRQWTRDFSHRSLKRGDKQHRGVLSLSAWIGPVETERE